MKKLISVIALLTYSLSLFSQLPTANLVAYWPFNGNANDYSGNTNNGAVNGPTLTTDRFGNPNSAYSFDGINDQIVITNNSTIDMTNSTNFSIAFWVKTYSGPTNTAIMSKNTYGLQSGYVFFTNNTDPGYCTTPGQLSFYAAAGAGGDACADNAIAGGSYLNTWIFITGVFDATLNQASLYVNGVLQADIGSVTGNLSTLTNLFIGSSAVNSGYFKGALDDIRIYKTKLTASQVNALYKECGAAPAVPVNSTVNQSICSGNTSILSATGGTLFNWYSSSTSTTALATSSQYTTPVLSAGTYTYYLENASCTFSAPLTRIAITVTTNVTPTVSAANGTICPGQSFSINPSGAPTYTISGGNMVVSPALTSTYSLTGSLAGCVSPPAIINVFVSAIPTIAVSGGTICVGQSFTLSPTGATNYSFSSGQIVSPASSSSYTVSGTNVNGCSGSTTVGVIVTPVPTVSANNGTICNGQSFTINPSGSTSYTISGGNLVVSPVSSSTYILIGGLGSCVSAPAIISVFVNAMPTIAVSGGTICAGQSFTLSPTGATNYSFSSGQIISPVSSSSYTVSGANSNGCSRSVTVGVTVNPVPNVSATNGTICNGQSFTINPSGGTSYTISGGNLVVSPVSSSTYILIGGLGSCVSAPVIVNVFVNALPTILVSGGVICAGQSFTFSPTGAVNYNFSGGSVVSPTLNTTYTISGTDANGCSNSTTVGVNVSQALAPTVFISGNNYVCQGSAVTLLAGGSAATYSWSNGMTGNLVTLSPTVSTNYTITATNSNNCSNTATKFITVNPLPVITVNSGVLCIGQSYTLAPLGALSYNYSGGSAVVSPTTNMIYTITGIDANGCTGSITSTVTVVPLPVITISAVNTNTLCAGETNTVTAAGGLTYSWNPGSTANPLVINPVSTTAYTVTGTDANGCSGKETFVQNVETCLSLNMLTENKNQLAVYPNPNNGEFTIESNGAISVKIINAIGQLILERQVTEGKNKLDLSNYSNGIYFIQFKKDSTTDIIKLIKN